jgi:uncharacterized damage-inducible protein DinB
MGMDYLELFERRGRVMDDLLMAASKLPPEAFVSPGPAGGASLRDLFLAWLEEQRRAVHASLLDKPYAPLPLAAHGGVFDVGRAFGGFRLTLRERMESIFAADLGRKVKWTQASGARIDVTIDELLAHLAMHDARMQGLVAERLRQLGASPPAVDLLG